jgi:hypothetical protein
MRHGGENMTDNEDQLNARARVEEWILAEDAIALRKDVGVGLRADPAARRASRSAAAKYGTGGVVEAMVLVGFLEKEGEAVHERGEFSGEDEEPTAKRLPIPPDGLGDSTGMGDAEEKAACRVLTAAGVLEIRDAGDDRLYPSREEAPADATLIYVLRLRPLKALMERGQE